MNKEEKNRKQKGIEERVDTELKTSDVNVRNPNDLLPGETEEQRAKRLGKDMKGQDS